MNKINNLPVLGLGALLLVGCAFLIFKSIDYKKDIYELQKNNDTLYQLVNTAKEQNNKNLEYLQVMCDVNNTVIALEGQAIAKSTKATVYWNKNNKSVYIDASSLPLPPKGKVYQVWALKLNPVLSPTSIGTLDNFDKNDAKFFKVDSAAYSEGFGITLEPEGGSEMPTMEQLYTLGKL
jgi:Anti-sigma-K factor rskA